MGMLVLCLWYFRLEPWNAHRCEESAHFSKFSGEEPPNSPPMLAPWEFAMAGWKKSKKFHSPIKIFDLATGPHQSIEKSVNYVEDPTSKDRRFLIRNHIGWEIFRSLQNSPVSTEQCVLFIITCTRLYTVVRSTQHLLFEKNMPDTLHTLCVRLSSSQSPTRNSWIHQLKKTSMNGSVSRERSPVRTQARI